MKINTRWKIVLFFSFLLIFGFQKTSTAQQHPARQAGGFDKSIFYAVMAKGDTDAINNEIKIVQESSPENKDGYEGALLMRNAGLVAVAKKKLKLFKAGCTKLETALLVDSDNAEFHFLRLSIQEHAPKVVKYHSDLEKDKLFIEKNFKSLSPVVQQAILDYCKKSNVIHIVPSTRD